MDTQLKLVAAFVAVLLPLAAYGQSPAPPGSAAQGAVGRITLPPVIVTAQKEPANIQIVPVSVTAVPRDVLENAGIKSVSDAGIYAPNTFFSELTARKISIARFRGVGSSPGNPVITTYIDGVPQLNTNSSSIELLDVAQIEFVRGPQSALFGRNALGGVINVNSGRPSLAGWTGNFLVPIGNYGAHEVRGGASGPLTQRVGVSLAGGWTEREGFTKNDITGHDLDNRSAAFGKGQVLWTPAANWEARVIVSGERARDGDYALNDLGALRRNPFHAARDFEGRTDRDLWSTTVLTRHENQTLSFSTTSGFVRWKTRDLTDLDYTPLNLIRRDNTEKDFQFTQEVRVASAADAPIALSEAVSLKWQSGIFFFTQNYDQDAVNTFSPFVLSRFVGFPVSQHSPQSALDDRGVGVYGQGTATFHERVDLTLGARLDYEKKEATLDTFFSPAIAPVMHVTGDNSFSNVSPQLALAYRFEPDRMAYASVGRGFKAGGFNPASPVGREAYGEEKTWNVEGGLKTSWAEGRLTANAAVFSIDWDDLQLNLPSPDVPGQFYIANVGRARSSGVEFELNARPRPDVGLFGSLGFTRARFKDGSSSSGVDVSDNKLPGSPDYTATVGGQYTRELSPAATLYGRGEVVFYGAFQYDDMNSAGQEAYSVANFRAGLRGKYLFAEAWIRNAFDTRYIPIAFAYGSLAPSGFIGEMGRPRTFGVGGGVRF